MPSTETATAARRPRIVIRPPRQFAELNPRELWAYRALFVDMVQRRLRTQFENQYLPILWAVARPLLMVLIFTFLKNISASRTGVSIPYPLYLYSGLILWFAFIEAVMNVATSIRADAAILTKVYFPRLLSPLAALVASGVNLAIAALPLVVMMVMFSEYPGWRLLLLPLVLAQIALLAFGLGCMFAAFGMASADSDHLLTFALYVGLFLSPVIYSPNLLPHGAGLIYHLNPLVGSLLAFRSTLFDAFPWPAEPMLYSACFSVIMAGLGLLLFQWTEKYFVERA